MGIKKTLKYVYKHPKKARKKVIKALKDGEKVIELAGYVLDVKDVVHVLKFLGFL